MKHVSVLVPKGAVALSCIEGSFRAFNTVNNFLQEMGRTPQFKVQLVGLDHESQVYDGLFKVQPDYSVKDQFRSDLIIVPAVNGDWDTVINTNRDFLPWIRQQHQAGAEVASLCVGAFLLASTGLMEGRKCSTHWLAANAFKKMFPEIELVPDKIITDEKGIYTSGGAISFWNLLLYIIEKYSGREMTILLAKYFEIEIDRYDQSRFIMFKGQKEHEDEQVRRAQEFIENNYQEKLSVEQLADMFALGRRSLERRFKKATNNTIIEYIQRVKVEAAKKSFENSRKNISEVMYDVGYTDTKAFRTTFKKISGLSPVEYRNKYNKQALMVVT